MVFFVWAASDATALEAVGYGTEHSLIWIIVGMVVVTGITMNSKHSSFAVWYLATWISYARMLGVVNAGLDSSTLDFMGKLSKGLNGFQIISHYERRSSNSRFSELGFESNHFFNNTEKFLIVFFGSIAWYLLMSVFGVCYQAVYEFKEKTYVNLMTRALIVCCFDFSLFGFLQIYHISLSTTYDTLCSIFAVMIVALYMVSLIYLPISIKAKTMDSSLEIHDSTLLFEFKYKEDYNCYYYIIFIITRVVAAIFLVFADSLPELQVSVLSLCGLTHLTFLLKYRPYRESLVNYIVIACEVCQLLMIASIACFISDISTSTSYFLRWLIIISFWSGVLLCFLRFLYHMLSKSSPVPPSSQVNGEDPPLKHKRDNSQTDLIPANPSKFSDQSRLEQFDNPQNFIQTSKQSSRSKPNPDPAFIPQASRQAGRPSSTSSTAKLNPLAQSAVSAISATSANAGKVLPVIKDLEADEESNITNLDIVQTPRPIESPSNDSQAPISPQGEGGNPFSGISYYPKLAYKYLKNYKINK